MKIALAALLGAVCCVVASAQDVLVEAEGFAERGGWFLDQQFMDVMGSPYLLAHGLGKPVADARTEVEFHQTGSYRLWVRTRDWVPPHHPGTFKIIVDGQSIEATFGTQGEEWLWQDGGTVQIPRKKVAIALHDLTGFEGRCDALYFTKDGEPPPDGDLEQQARWRRKLLGLPDVPPARDFDVVVVGGGISGCCAALTAARLGLKVALVQDRPVLGGVGSTEIAVNPVGTGGRVVDEVVGNHGYQRVRLLQSEEGLSLHLNTHAFRVLKEGDRIVRVDGKDIATGAELGFRAPVFVDCTGDGWIGYWAGADWRMGRESRDEFNEPLAPEKGDKMTLGTTIMWTAKLQEQECPFPELPWAQDVGLKELRWVYEREDFRRGGWMWEYGHNLDTIQDAEKIRDHLLRVIYGTWSNAKNGKERAELARFELVKAPAVAGKRESRRLLGDYILTEHDIVEGKQFPDAVAVRSWPIDLHFPLSHYPGGPDVDFITRAEYKRIGPSTIPFRMLYSRNIANLMMAGRDVSATHVALGSVRVMKTGGQMGVAVGAAALLCKKHDTTPRGVYRDHLKELLDIVNERGAYEGALTRGE